MRKFTFICLTILLIFAFTIPVMAQYGPLSWSKTASKVLREGILYPEPADYFVFFDDFFDYRENSADDSLFFLGEVGYINTFVSAGTGTTTLSILDESGGILRCINAGNESDGANVQWSSEIFVPGTTKDLQFEARVKISEYIQTDFCIGLISTDTTMMDATVDGIYFLVADGDSVIDAMSTKDSASKTTATSVEFVDNTWITLGFVWNKVDLKYYIDGALVATHNYTAAGDSIPTDAELTPSIAFLNGAAAVESTYVDYIWSRQDR